MNSASSGESSFEDLYGVRSYLLSVAKDRWALALVCAYVAVVTIPFLAIIGAPPWTGPCAAAGFTIAGKLLGWWSDSVRKDAEWLHRRVEYAQGIGYAVDESSLATIKSKYSRFSRHWEQRATEEVGYYEASGSPSPLLLAMMLRESAWWTQQLASKAFVLVLVTACLVVFLSLGIVIMIARQSVDLSILLTIYACVVCAIASLDTLYLAMKYKTLSSSSEKAFKRLNALSSKGNADETSTLIAVADYQNSRSNGPLVPDWFKKRHQGDLQKIWDKDLSQRVSGGPRTG